MWDSMFSSDQEAAYKLVRENMGIYGIKWPKEGNPFEDWMKRGVMHL